jgi:GGDEF domain-containing protein
VPQDVIAGPDAPAGPPSIVTLSAEDPFAAHDLRGREPEPWAAAIERRLARHADDARPFAVLLVEVDDVDRLLASDARGEASGALEAAERALAGALRPADALLRERLGRYWITAPDTPAPDGRMLAERAAAAVGDAVQLRGAPLTVSVGVAGCPEDGLSVQMLVARADEGVFAARAAGVRLA